MYFSIPAAFQNRVIIYCFYKTFDYLVTYPHTTNIGFKNCKRNQELFFPIYFIAILAMIKAFIPKNEKPAIKNIPSYSIYNNSVFNFNLSNTVLVTPDTNDIQNLAAKTMTIFGELGSLNYIPPLKFFQNEAQMVDYEAANPKTVSAGIVFQYTAGNNLSYAIRMGKKKVPNTNNYYFTGQDGCRDPGTGLASDNCDANKLSWGLVYTVLIIIVTAVVVVIARLASFFGGGSNLFLLFMILFGYGLSIVALAFVISTFFNNPKTAGGIASLTTILLSLLYLVVSLTRSYSPTGEVTYSIPVSVRWVLCLLSPCAVALALDQGLYLDIRFGGMTFETARSGEFPLYGPLIMLFVDTVLYLLLATYLDNVLPGAYGAKYKPWYFLTKSFWCPSGRNENKAFKQISDDRQFFGKDVENVSPETRQNIAVRIHGITKQFTGKNKEVIKAVNDLSLEMYKGQITGLLGHNGAGKTTLMNMILQMMAEKVLNDVNLSEQIDVFAKNLSGGQKRKLSVAIALIGDPKIIFLDEPTADRKAFISKGKLRCFGSSLFLKNRFGIGYHLNMVVEPACDIESVTHLVKQYVEGAELMRVHGKELAYTLPIDRVSQFPELFGSLEKPSTDLSNVAEAMGIKTYGVSMTSLEEVFLKLEEDDTSVELDQLLESTKINDNKEIRVKYGSFAIGSADVTSIQVDEPYKIPETDCHVNTSQQFWALAWIRFLGILRNKALFFIHSFLPVVFVLVGLFIQKYAVSSETDKDFTPVALNALYTAAAYAGVNKTMFNLNTTSKTAMLLKNSDTGPYSVAFLNRLSSFIVTENYNNVSELQSVSPHFMGIDLETLMYNSTEQVYDSGFTLLYNDSAVHSIPALINLMSLSLLNMNAAITNMTLTAGINLMASSLPWKGYDTVLSYSNSVFSASILIAMAFVATPPGFAVELCTDRYHKVRSQLRATGIKFSVYYGANFFVDVIKFYIPAILCLIIIPALQIEGLDNGGAIVSLILIFLTYIPANTLYSYVWSFAFKDPELCQSMLTMIIFFLGFIPFMIVSLIDMIVQDDGKRIAGIIHSVFCVIDCTYPIFGGVYFISRVDRYKKLTEQTPVFSDYFDPDNYILIAIIMPFVHIFIWLFLLRYFDIRATGGDTRETIPCLSKSQQQIEPSENTDIMEDEDEDVAAERRRVAGFHNVSEVEYPVALIENLRKEFIKEGKSKGKYCTKVKEEDHVKVAVRNASFAVDAGEVVIGGHSVRSSMSDAFQAMGYCPQHDALWQNISLKEHLECYAAIRGISKQQIDGLIEYFMENLKVNEHADKHAKKLSGGTKRKLSYVMSMLGKPKIVLLDEPSTGMDPKSKRFLDTISTNFCGTERGAVLTTHYMEEADALCNRVAIMVNGKIVCLGATQHLKNKFSSGHLLEIKIKTEGSETAIVIEQKMDALEQYIYTLFPQASCLERFGLRVQYKIPKENVKSLAEAFSALERGKSSHAIEEYSFSQSTLEQVFLEFAKRQKDENSHDNEKEGRADNTTFDGATLIRSTSSRPRHENQAAPSVKL
ncbi:hypothetical protein KUTeg_023419 [Tegillarca granosa]|uniref:ABC transporter domain-containing protein n=1 Tax=Tegillarca granosa TaxID=220873 RepID=A0ABQ9E1L7_TEGGR|nr:hypothetical protein KUTeg_023419 [Tegillarca granosa]